MRTRNEQNYDLKVDDFKGMAKAESDPGGRRDGLGELRAER